MLTIVAGFGIFFAGLIVGVGLEVWLRSMSSYTGKMVITEEETGLKYTLEVFDDPELIQYKKEIVFKVESPKKIDRS